MSLKFLARSVILCIAAIASLATADAKAAILLSQDTAVNWIFQPTGQGAGGNFSAADLEYFFDNDLAPSGWTYGDGNPPYPDLTYSLGTDPLSLGYKGNNNGTEEGLTGYQMTFSADNEYATLSYESGTIVQREHMFLIVKDGNARPNLYVYDLNRIDLGGGNYTSWNGTESINIGNISHMLFGANGSISHAEIVVGGDDVTNIPGGVPEPATLVLWSTLALCGSAVGFRRRFAKA